MINVSKKLKELRVKKLFTKKTKNLLFLIDKFFLVWYYIGVIKEEMIMKILNEKEIKFLEVAVRDYKDAIDYFIKCYSTCIKTIDFICYNGSRFSIPFNTKLFRGMRANKKYTPEELGLFIDERDEEIKKLKQQLAEKDKEIQLLREDCNASIKLVREVQEKITRHQVCEEIRQKSSAIRLLEDDRIIRYVINSYVLDEIEKGGAI